MCIWFEMKPKQESARLTEYLKFQTLFERKNENIFSPNEENAFFLSWKRISLFFKNEWKWLFSILFLSIDSIFIRQKPVELGKCLKCKPKWEWKCNWKQNTRWWDPFGGVVSQHRMAPKQDNLVFSSGYSDGISIGAPIQEDSK